MSQVQPISLTGGIFLQSTQYDHKLHMDTAHIRYLNAKHGIKPTHLGVIEHFITSGYLKNMDSIFDFTGVNPEIIEVKGGVYTWDSPMATDDFYLIEDLSTGAKPGIDGQPFKLRFNRRAVGNTATIKHSKFARFELLVTNDEIVKDGDTWVYTVTLKGQNSHNAWFPKEYLTSGTKFVQGSSHSGDTSTIYNTGELASTKFATYYNYVGQSRSNFYYTVGGGASGYTIPNQEVISLQDYAKVIEMVFFKPNSEAFEAQLQGKNPINAIYKGDKNAAARDVAFQSWVSAADVAAMKRIELDCLQEAIWGVGGQVLIDGQIVNTPIGLYHQLNRGNQHFFSIENMTITKLEGILASFFNGRQEMFQNNVIEMTVGEGFMALVHRMLENIPAAKGMLINSDRYLDGPTNDMHFKTPRITSFDFAFGTVRFKVNRGFNPMHDNDVENPMIGPYRLSSYMAVVMDVISGQNSNNVKMLRSTDGWDYTQVYENGKGNYLGAPHGTPGQIDKPWDFRVAFTKKHYAYWVMDPTKAFILKPYNPITKKPFGEI